MMVSLPIPLDALPGFRRRIMVQPGPGRCVVDLEDDYHRMTVIVAHADGMATTVGAAMERVPWTICPGAREQLARSCASQPLAAFARMGGKAENCTHLFDLAQLAAAHADDALPLLIDIVVSDPRDGLRHAALRRNGAMALGWSFSDRQFVSPDAIAGLSLYGLRDWIDGLNPAGQEAARLLRWASMLAHGRTTDRALQDDPALLPRGTCFTFQESRVAGAVRHGDSIRDFRPAAPGPLAGITQPLDGRRTAASIAVAVTARTDGSPPANSL